MTDREAQLAALVRAALAAQERGRDAPAFAHLWTRAEAAARGGRTAPASSIWSVATALAVLMAVGVGIHGLRPARTADRASAALMRELAANVSWRAPSDHLPGLADRSLIAELPEIPMVDTSPEEFHL